MTLPSHVVRECDAHFRSPDPYLLRGVREISTTVSHEPHPLYILYAFPLVRRVHERQFVRSSAEAQGSRDHLRFLEFFLHISWTTVKYKCINLQDNLRRLGYQILVDTT